MTKEMLVYQDLIDKERGALQRIWTFLIIILGLHNH